VVLSLQLSYVWFDRYSITPDVPEHTETLNEIGEEVKNLVNDITSTGVPLNRIVIGIFNFDVNCSKYNFSMY